eukprot:CAMPEP_0115155272 /NCGR_PEP_ID=MMETSP0227-20121206/67796_1 /TAXON_ID=89957 /ORGANISM="Polarella glacialis, Strain CCMP 1383" /LENGTH=37 /DNA_ID= /DNA_START= /DNA_END= /DNA_ORIENTATION=
MLRKQGLAGSLCRRAAMCQSHGSEPLSNRGLPLQRLR